MAANSWMQHPVGYQMVAGLPINSHQVQGAVA
jgi:cytochrome bd-type quinol oxidase subunit 1